MLSPSEVKQLTVESTEGSSTISLYHCLKARSFAFPGNPPTTSQKLAAAQTSATTHTLSSIPDTGFQQPCHPPAFMQQDLAARRTFKAAGCARALLPKAGNVFGVMFSSKTSRSQEAAGQTVLQTSFLCPTAQWAKPKPTTSGALQYQGALVFPLKELYFQRRRKVGGL